MRQKRIESTRVILVSCLLFLFSAETVSAQERVRVLSPRPWIAHADLEKDVAIIYAITSLYAQSMNTGQRLWSLPFSEGFGGINETDILVRDRDTIRLYDIITGKLRKSLSVHIGRNENVSFIGNTAWIDASQSVITPEGQSLPIPIPTENSYSVQVVGWMPDGNTLLITHRSVQEASSWTLTTYFWEPRSDRIVKAYDLSSNQDLFFAHLTPEGKAVLVDKGTLTLLDARSGAVLRDLGKSGPQFTEDGHMLATNDKRNSVTATHLETGEVVAVLSGPEHSFNVYFSIKAYGKNWVLSEDEHRRRWLWPVEAGSAPRML